MVHCLYYRTRNIVVNRNVRHNVFVQYGEWIRDNEVQLN